MYDTRQEAEIRRDRLSRLQQLVSEIPAQLLKMDQLRQETCCGIAHCAAGWAGLDPEFNREGLSWHRAEGLHCLVFDSPDGPLYDFVACEAFFGLTQTQSSNLFGYKLLKGDIVRKAEVVANIDRLLSGMATQPYLRPVLHQVSVERSSWTLQQS